MTTPAWNVSGQYYETCNCDFVCACVPGQLAVRPTKGECQFAIELRLENTGHPAADTFTLAHASRSHVHALGLGWDDVSGKNNGQYAPFSWKSA